MNIELVFMSQKSSLVITVIVLSFVLGIMLGRYIFPKQDKVEVIDINKEYYATQIRKNLSTIDSLESRIKIQESIVDSFLNLRERVRIEYIVKREEMKSLPLDSSVLVLRNFIKEYEENPVNFSAITRRNKQ